MVRTAYNFFLIGLLLVGTFFSVTQGDRLERDTTGSSSSSSASSGSGGGAISFSGPQPNLGFPMFQPFFNFPPVDFNNLANQYYYNLAAQHSQAAAAAAGFPFAPNPYPFPDPSLNTISPELGTRMGPGPGPGGNVAAASSSVSFGPNGGHGEASVYPSPDGVATRIAQDFPPPSNGGTYGMFVSSSSGTSDVNGKRTSYKTSTFGTNDNGKITFRTVNQ